MPLGWTCLVGETCLMGEHTASEKGWASVDRLLDKVAVITGAGTGIGLAIATLFHREGCRLVLADISGDQDDVAAALPGALPIRCDVSNADDMSKMFARAEEAFGKLDILVGNAGIGTPAKLIVDDDVTTIEKLLAVNTKSAWLGIHYAAPIMQRAGKGSIILMGSMAGLLGFSGMSAYAASKAGIVGLTVSAARELGGDGVRVNAICPGPTDTEKRRAFRAENGLAVHQAPEELPIALGRVGQPSEIANAALFLASDESSFITGAVLPVSGGQYS